MCSRVCGPLGKPPPPNFTRYHDITYVVHTNVFVRYFCRFIRTWDRHDRDPAEASRTLTDFRNTLHTLFVEGYILCDPGGHGEGSPNRPDLCTIAGLGPAKTITQIALEQCEDMLVVNVGAKQKRLWSRTSHADCTVVMAEMKSIVGDVMARLDADFATNDLYMCLRAFDLREWSQLLAAGRAGSVPDVTATTLENLKRKARWLCKALQVTWSLDEWLQAVRVALRCRRALTADPDIDPNQLNRMAWATALATPQNSSQIAQVPVEESFAAGGPSSSPGCVQVFGVLIRFYLSVLDGTGDVERGLGRLAAIQACHAGGSPEGAVSYAEASLELSVEGPQDEASVCKQPATVGGSLLLTHFSRQCAVLWQQLHGRRFACQRQRSDAGRQKTGWRLKGSMKAVKFLHIEATDKLLQQSQEDKCDGTLRHRRATIVGMSRMSVLTPGDVAVAGPKLHTFRTSTEQRLQAKSQFKVWPGFGPAPPKLRARYVAGKNNAASGNDHSQLLRARLWLVRSKQGVPDVSKAKRRKQNSTSMQAAKVAASPGDMQQPRGTVRKSTAAGSSHATERKQLPHRMAKPSRSIEPNQRCAKSAPVYDSLFLQYMAHRAARLRQPRVT